MRVAIIVKSFPVVSETFILRQITGLIDRGHDVDIYARTLPAQGEPVHAAVASYDLLSRTTYVDPQVPAASSYWQMPVYPLSGETWLPGASKAIPNIRRAAAALPTLVRCAIAAPRLTLESLEKRAYDGAARNLTALYYLGVLVRSRKRYDVVHVHYGPVANLFRFAGKLFDAPLIVSFHGFDFTKVAPIGARHPYDRLFSSADFIVVNGKYARERLRSLGCPDAKLAEIHYGIDSDEFVYRKRTGRRGEPVRLLTVARLVPKKGLEYAIRAVADLRARNYQLTYEIAGEGRERDALKQLIGKLGLDGIVTLLGAQDGETVKKIMDGADIFVLPSVTGDDGDQEGTPVALMEAQAVGLPVVSTWHGGIPEVVQHKKTGLLVAERDVDELATAIEFLIQHEDQRDQLGRAGAEHIREHYDLERVNNDLIELYTRARELHA